MFGCGIVELDAEDTGSFPLKLWRGISILTGTLLTLTGKDTL
jgi:hypothetical protein